MGTLAEGIKEIFATAKTTGSNVMLCGNDGTPDGHITMANLASVLGAIYHGGYLDESADNKQSDSVYFVYGDTSKNTPTGHGVLVTLGSSLSGNYGPSISQQFFDNVNGGYYTRIANSGVWGEWESVPSFYKNYSDLSSLANALGALYHMFNYTYEIKSGEQQVIQNTYLGAVVFCTSRNSGRTYIMQIPYYTGFEETYGEEFKVKRTSPGSSAVIENISVNTAPVRLIVFGMDF